MNSEEDELEKKLSTIMKSNYQLNVWNYFPRTNINLCANEAKPSKYR